MVFNKAAYPKSDPEQAARWRERLGERFSSPLGMRARLHILLEYDPQGCRLPAGLPVPGPLEVELTAQAAALGQVMSSSSAVSTMRTRPPCWS